MKKCLFSKAERVFVEAVGDLAFGNPFLPERLELEKKALGEAFVGGVAVWSVDAERLGDNPNVREIQQRAERLAFGAREKLVLGCQLSRGERQLYEDLVLYVMYYRYDEAFFEEIQSHSEARETQRPVVFYSRFCSDVREFFSARSLFEKSDDEIGHLFALFFQARRAFHYTFRHIYGGSLAMGRLRAAVWQSIFTHNPRRYRRSLYTRMHEIPTLVTGPSGTGKDLVASAIGRSAFIPFDIRSQTFVHDYRCIHLALNLSALTPTLIESELFGHKKGSFTGALFDRSGFLEDCSPSHSVLLDEIGDLDAGIQVKLLRLLQTRDFRRIGETRKRYFGGKVIAATNRDLREALNEGRFREDFYYRLCADLVETPTLFEQLEDAPEELHNLIVLLVRRLVSDEDASEVAVEVEAWIENKIGRDYRWPGNVRELEQCVRNILVRGSYWPLQLGRTSENALERIGDEVKGGQVTADQLLSRYCTLMYSKTGSYQAAARALQLDRRTVKSKVDRDLLDEIRKSGAGRRS